jgi:AcrR family transcriptional regulator
MSVDRMFATRWTLQKKSKLEWKAILFAAELIFVKTTNHRRKPRPIRARLDEERLTDILDVATEVFVSEGFSAASTNEIARRANSSKTTFYSRFPTKEQLFLAVIERRMTGIFRQVAGSLPEAPHRRDSPKFRLSHD